MITRRGLVGGFALPWSRLEPLGAAGDGQRDDWPALQAMMDQLGREGSPRALARGHIPAGVYCISQPLAVRSNTDIICDGAIRLTGGPDCGHTVLIRSQQNVRWQGGVIDANFQTNDNPLAISGLHSLGGNSHNIRIRSVRLINARSKGRIPQDVGRGGGKGFTVQFGVYDTVIEDVEIENCDIGFSIEGKQADGGRTHDVTIRNVRVRDSALAGAYLFGLFRGSADHLSAKLDELVFDDCAEASPFGVIHGVGATGIHGRRIVVRNRSPKAEIIRGSFRDCDLDIRVAGTAPTKAINFSPSPGANDREARSFGNRFELIDANGRPVAAGA